MINFNLIDSRMMALDEAVEALNVALDYKNDTIAARQRELRSSLQMSTSSENYLSRLGALSAGETRALLARYFDRVVELRDAQRKMEHHRSELEVGDILNEISVYLPASVRMLWLSCLICISVFWYLPVFKLWLCMAGENENYLTKIKYLPLHHLWRCMQFRASSLVIALSFVIALQMRLEEQTTKSLELEASLQHTSMDADCRLTKQQQEYERKIQLLMKQLTETELSSRANYSTELRAKDTRFALQDLSYFGDLVPRRC